MADTTTIINVICQQLQKEVSIDEIMFLFIEMVGLVVLSHVFHFFLKRFDQPSVVSQLLAGLFLGRTFVNRVVDFQLYKLDDDGHLMGMATMGSSLFMFLIGIEMDFQYLRRSFHSASFFTFGNTITSTFIALIAGPILYGAVDIHGGRVMFVFILIIILSNSSSLMLIRMMTELKLTMSEVGRIGVSASLINDVNCLSIIAMVVLFPMPHKNNNKSAREALVVGIGALAVISVCAGLLRMVVQFINRMNMKREVIPEEVLWVLLLMVFSLSTLTDFLGFHSMIVAFILGVAFPKVGPATRTVTRRLTVVVNTFVLPIYFGYTGVLTDLFMLRNGKVLITVVSIVVLGTFGKVASTALVAKYLRMQVKEGMVLGFLLNVKGHVELIVVTLGTNYGIWGKEIHQALLISMLFSSMTAGPAAAYIVRRERRAIKYQSSGLEWLDLDREFRVLACVHSPHDIPTILDLIQISSGIDSTLLAPYLMHLIEFTGKIATPMLYNQIQEDSDDLHSQSVRQVNAVIDAFNIETGIKLRQFTAISRFANMHEDICNGAKDIRASLIIVPYHRKQRFDGKMGARKDRAREFNMNVLRCAPCTIGILVDRGLGCGGGAIMGMTSSAVSGEQKMYHVVALFFGGPDDREAVAYGSRLAMHPCVSVTVMRFKSFQKGSDDSRKESGSSYKSSEVLDMAEVDVSDEEFMVDFHNRFVTTELITYVEQVVANLEEPMTTLASMKGMYSLFIVGRQQKGPATHLTEGLSIRQECDELGVIGGLLASSDFMFNGSVLVLQQHVVTRDESLEAISTSNQLDFDDEFSV